MHGVHRRADGGRQVRKVRHVRTVAEVVAWLKKTGSPEAAAKLARYGLPTTDALWHLRCHAA